MLSSFFILSCNSQKVKNKQSSGSSEVKKSKEKSGEIVLTPPNEFKEKISQEKFAQLVDIRTPEEINENGMIEGAININFNDENFLEKMDTLNKNEAIYIYCRSGGRSGKAAAELQAKGFKKIYDLKGGYNAWLTEFK